MIWSRKWQAYHGSISMKRKNTKVIIRYAEVLYPDLPEYGENVGKMMLENYRDATSTDIYICSGEEGEVYQPRFTFPHFWVY